MEENKEQEEGDLAIPMEDKQEEGDPAIPPPAIRGGPTRRGGAVKRSRSPLLAKPRRMVYKQLATKPVFRRRDSRDKPHSRGRALTEGLTGEGSVLKWIKDEGSKGSKGVHSSKEGGGS